MSLIQKCHSTIPRTNGLLRHIQKCSSATNQSNFSTNAVHEHLSKLIQQHQQDRINSQHVTNAHQLEDTINRSEQQQRLIKKLRILLLSNTHNSMSQAVYLMLTQMGHNVMIEMALSSSQMEQVAAELNPDLIICPFLTKVVPENLFRKVKTLIVHPGIVGDRGIHSLDWALLEEQKEWGVTIMEADKEMDAGPIYATQNFSLANLPLSQLTKSKVYRNQVIPAALQSINRAVRNFIEQIEPTPLDYSNPTVRGTLKPTMKQSQCTINWEEDDARTIVRKISSRDSNPGLLDNSLFGCGMYLYGAHIEKLIKVPSNTPSKQLLGQRDGAILISCQGGNGEAVWITHMKRVRPYNIKLPATRVIDPDQLSTLPILSVSFNTVPTDVTFNEIYYEKKNDIIFLHFDFYNGAMSTTQCQRLLQALNEIEQINNFKILVLCGGRSYFSNGIHLNVIEAAEDKYIESYANINALNDVILKIMSMKNKITISALQGNAGAGGVMMSLAADYVYANSEVVLNPHYRTMGLFGSEYWTYNLSRRIGFDNARQITEACEPLSAQKAEEIHLIDRILCQSSDELLTKVEMMAHLLTIDVIYDNLIKKKKEEDGPLFYDKLAACRSTELAKMAENFRNSSYNLARHSFVYKTPPVITPWHIKKLGRETAIRVNGKEIAKHIQTNISQKIKSLQSHAIEAGLTPRSPGLACLIVGNRRDSLLYVQKKNSLASSFGFLTQVVHINDNQSSSIDELEAVILQQINQWNNDPLIDGIVVQLPLPEQLDRRRILDTICLEKDVDGLHSLQLADLCISSTSPSSSTSFIPCTVRGILHLLEFYHVKLPGKVVCIVGASKTVGLPLALALSSRGCTVTICTVQTNHLQEKVERADILIASAGVANLVKADWIRPGAVVIDAGITVMENELTKQITVCGDVEKTDNLWKRASLITPVPGGVGPMTVVMLLQNTLDAYKARLTQEILKTTQK
ncbi:unnamed protein product [Adineta steineri]|uniref:methenyltetrahydrofolate cyclohydrolase n=1 Tax=Adineta steineri TaxID=433720 RepID=A0A819UXC1_9BILA|nr:unnamed protein product [Adineta steineri]